MNKALKNLDLWQIVGFVISLGVSLLLLALGVDKIPSITFGCVLAALTQLFDLQKRNADSEEHILQANKLTSALYRDSDLFILVQQIVQDYLSVKEVPVDSFRIRADDAINECKKVLGEMAQDHLTVERGSPYMSGTYTIAKAKTAVRAVAAMEPNAWRTPDGETYMRENAAAAKRPHVRVTRVFTYPLATLRELTDVLEKQQKLGIDVRIAPAESLAQDLNEDYMIIDDWLALRTDPSGRFTTMTINKAEIDQISRRFDTLLRHTKKLDDATDILKPN